jgi:4-hydroxybenzoate polyprenyltransferase
VTAIAAAMAVAAGIHARSALLAIAVLCGQLSVGWSNDAIDAPLDTHAGRRDKPIATGVISRRTVAWCAAVALVLDVPLSLALGWRAGVAHLAAVALAWSYNLGLKRTIVSVVPYAVAFALLPVVVAAMLPGAPGPRVTLIVAGGACGIAAHFANTVGDASEDAVTGVRGLPQRVGPPGSTVIAGGFVALAVVLILIAAGANALTVGAAVVDVAIALGLPLAVRVPQARRLAFRLVIAAVALLVVAFVVSGGAHLTPRSSDPAATAQASTAAFTGPSRTANTRVSTLTALSIPCSVTERANGAVKERV